MWNNSPSGRILPRTSPSCPFPHAHVSPLLGMVVYLKGPCGFTDVDRKALRMHRAVRVATWLLQIPLPFSLPAKGTMSCHFDHPQNLTVVEDTDRMLTEMFPLTTPTPRNSPVSPKSGLSWASSCSFLLGPLKFRVLKHPLVYSADPSHFNSTLPDVVV